MAKPDRLEKKKKLVLIPAFSLALNQRREALKKDELILQQSKGTHPVNGRV